MTVKHRLQEYKWIKENINELEDRLLEIDTQLQKVTTQLTADRVSTTKEPDKFTDLINERIEVEKLINNQICKGLREMQFIEDAIEKLDERDKLLMRLRYIRNHKWEQICVELNYEWAQTHRHHARILERLKRDTK